MNLSKLNIYSLGLIALAGITLSGCSDSDTALETVGNGPVKVMASMAGTEAGEAVLTEGTKVTMSANGNKYNYTLGTDGTLTADGTPLNWTGTDFTVRAWTPATDGPIGLTDQSTAEKMAACDLLAAETQITSRYGYLIFDHCMTQVVWDFRYIDPSYTAEQVSAARVSLLGYGSISFADGKVTAAGSPDSEISTYETSADGQRTGRAIMAPAEMWDHALIRIVIGGDEYTYIPSRSNVSDALTAAGELVPGKVQKYHIAISRKVLSVEMESTDVAWSGSQEFGKDDIADAKLEAQVAADVTSLPGYKVSGIENGYITDRAAGFSITYTEENLDGLTWSGSCKVTRTEVAGNDGSSVQTYTFTDCKTDISVSAIGAPEVGDYVYDNGTWGKDETRYGCTTIGRVFRAGRDANDDSDYSLCKVRGYVVPLAFANNTPMKWFVNQSEKKYLDALSNIPVATDPAVRESYYGGYLLTGLLNADLAPFSADWASEVPFWYAYKNIDMSSPALSSGWYIPSYAQLKDVCASKMYAAFSNVYWSSQVYPGIGDPATGGVGEGEKTTLWAIRCTDSQAVGYGWAIDDAKLLVVLTF